MFEQENQPKESPTVIAALNQINITLGFILAEVKKQSAMSERLMQSVQVQSAPGATSAGGEGNPAPNPPAPEVPEPGQGPTA